MDQIESLAAVGEFENHQAERSMSSQ